MNQPTSERLSHTRAQSLEEHTEQILGGDAERIGEGLEAPGSLRGSYTRVV